MTAPRLFLFALVTTPLAAQQPVPVQLKPQVEFAEPVAVVTGWRELADGRVLVSDARLGEIVVIDFKSGKSEPISRKGSGPLEYRDEGVIIALSRDTLAMYDPGNARLLLLSREAKPIGTTGLVPNVAQLLSEARWSDGNGRFYSNVWIRPTDDRRLTDSAYILSYNLRTSHLDSITAVRNVPMDMVSESTGNGNGMVRMEEIPFSVHDEWTVTTDGRVAVARGRDYHLEYYQYGKPRQVALPTPFIAVKVTEADKDSARARRKADANPGGVSVNPEPSVWEKTMPAFPVNSMRPAPNGRVLVERSHSLSTSVRTYDLFDARGVRQYAVTLPPMTRFIGAGATAEYALRVDADGQLFLEKFVLR